MWTIYKTATFESAHLLEGHPKCGKLHGHSYKLEVWASSTVLESKFNFVLDFHAITDIAKAYDHSDVVIPISCEELTRNISKQIMAWAKEGGYTVTALKVRLWETPTAYAEYIS